VRDAEGHGPRTVSTVVTAFAPIARLVTLSGWSASGSTWLRTRDCFRFRTD
jgi:hypothetical protein